jgi:hypothetical protein
MDSLAKLRGSQDAPAISEEARQMLADLERGHPLGESDFDNWRRKKEAEEAERKERAAHEVEAIKRQQQGDWAEWYVKLYERIAALFDAKWAALLADPKGDLAKLCGLTLHLARKFVRHQIAELKAELEAKLAGMEERLKSVPGRLPPVKVWSKGCVTYEGEFASFDGSLWQAREDTGERPGGGDWVCVACGASTAQRGEVDIRVSDRERWRARDDIAEAIAKLRTEVEKKFATMEERWRTIAGKLPLARAWALETVTYQGSFVVHDGACWQALTDTAQHPGGEDWILIVRAGRDGRDGRGICLRGSYDMHDAYARLDVVEFGGEPFIALCDNPGMCPRTAGSCSHRAAPKGTRVNADHAA